MKIFGDILNHATTMAKQNKGAKLQVVDTVNSFWQQVNREHRQAKLFDASSLMSSFSKTSSPVKNFERGVEFGNLSPFNQSVWIEIVDSDLRANLAVLLTYTEKSGQAMAQAERYGIKNSFKWTCQARSFLKRQYQPTLPLKWEWVEYIDANGGSVSSLLKPAEFPEYINRVLEPELKNVEFIHHHLCAFIANLGLYTVDLINNNQVTVTSHDTGRFAYQVVERKENGPSAWGKLDEALD